VTLGFSTARQIFVEASQPITQISTKLK